jgi:hypothetical protein
MPPTTALAFSSSAWLCATEPRRLLSRRDHGRVWPLGYWDNCLARGPRHPARRAFTMAAVGFGALAANTASFALLWAYRSGDANMRSTWISQLRPDLHGRANAMPRRAPASAKSSLVRAPPKSIPPRNAGALGGWLRQRSGVQTQFWSVRFIGDSLVTSSLQNVADYIPAMCSSGGSSALVVQSIDRNGYAPVSNFEDQASGPIAYVQIPAPPSPSLANSRKPQAATKFEGIAHRFLISAYSSFAPARFTTSAHFADSCLMRAANSSGVPPAGSSPICS